MPSTKRFRTLCRRRQRRQLLAFAVIIGALLVLTSLFHSGASDETEGWWSATWHFASRFRPVSRHAALLKLQSIANERELKSVTGNTAVVDLHELGMDHDRSMITELGHLPELDQDSIAVVWRLPVGCDFSGFFVEVLSLLPAVEDILPGSFYLDMGHCGPEILHKLATKERKVLEQLQKYSENILERITEARQPYVLIQHHLPGNEYMHWRGAHAHRPLLTIGRAMTESSLISEAEVELTKAVDMVWVPTLWHKNVFSAGGIPQHRISIFPEAVDAHHFNPHGIQRTTSKELYHFLSVFKWEHRKGYDVLLKAYWTEFMHQRDAVTLELRTYKPPWEPGFDDLNLQIVQIAQDLFSKKVSELPPVTVIGSDLSRDELRQMYKNADAFVLPTRGEGWGLPIVEAMSMSLPVIVTNFSGPTAFINKRTAFPVRVESENPDGTVEPDVDHLREQLRTVFDNQQLARHVGKRARDYIKSHYSPRRIARQLINLVEKSIGLSIRL